MTTDKWYHCRTIDILILASSGPVIEVLIVHTTRGEHVVNHCMVEDKVSLTIECIWTDVVVDGAILIGIFL